MKLPAILLEGDEPSPLPAPVPSGPGERYILGPTPPKARPAGDELGELPDAYGTGDLFLTARDPHWLYAGWDLALEPQRKSNLLSADRHLIGRVFLNEVKGTPISETHVHPESRHWFIHVGRGGTHFVAQLGYYAKAGLPLDRFGDVGRGRYAKRYGFGRTGTSNF